MKISTAVRQKEQAMDLQTLSTATYCRVRFLIDSMPRNRATLMYLRLGGESDIERLSAAVGLSVSEAQTELESGEAQLRRALFSGGSGKTPSSEEATPLELLGDSAAATAKPLSADDSLQGTRAFPDLVSERAVVELYRRAFRAANDGSGVSEFELSLFLLVAAACISVSLQPLIWFLSFD